MLDRAKGGVVEPVFLPELNLVPMVGAQEAMF